MRLSVISDQISLDEEKAFSQIQKEGYQEVELHDVFGHSIEECTPSKTIKKTVGQIWPAGFKSGIHNLLFVPVNSG